MIDLKEIEAYNKVLRYAAGKYRSWNPVEDKALKESAPLVKFTLSKTIRQTEDRHINEILNYATLAKATHVVITCNIIQMLVCYDAHPTLDTSHTQSISIHSNLVQLGGRDYYSTHSIDNTHKLSTIMVAKHERFAGVLPFDTKRDGLYIRRGDGSFTLERNRKKLVKMYDDLGYVSRPGTPPTVVSPDEVSKGEMLKILDVLAFCNQMGNTSVWTEALARPLRKSITNYRSMATMPHEHVIKKIIAATRMR